MTRGDESAVELFLVDCGIENLRNVYLDLPQLEMLNLHSNYIAKIVNLDRLLNLRVLDLSSNHISRMEGLEHLQHLQHLNMACNEVAVLEGISKLMSLVVLNLSYNVVTDIGGLAVLRGTDYRLQLIELQGNRLSDLRHVAESVRHCRSLKYLVLEDSAADNPVCLVPGYKNLISNAAPGIISLVKHDVPEQLLFAANAAHQDSLTDPKSGNEPTKLNVDVQTPFIDFVLQQRRTAASQASPSEKRSAAAAHTQQAAGFGTTASSADTSGTDAGHPGVRTSRERALRAKLDELERELLAGRLDRLERQLAVLTVAHPLKVEQSDTEVRTEDSSNADSAGTAEQREVARPARPAVKRVVPDMQGVEQRASAAKPRAAASKTGQQPSKAASRAAAAADAAATAASAAAAATDAANREAVNVTYTQFLNDLASERERRWKAEEAAKKLAEEFATLRTKCAEMEQRGRNYEEALRSTQKGAATEQQLRKAAEESASKLKIELQAAESRFKEAARSADEERAMRHAAEESVTKLERHSHEQLLRHADERQAAERALGASREEAAALQRSCTALKADLDGMRSLLAAREQEHRSQIEQRYSVDSPKLEELLEARVASLVKKHSLQVEQLEERMAVQHTDYAALEDEFRLALQVEAERFNTLQDAYEKLSTDNAQCRQALASATSKDERSTKIVADMTQLIKEQKDKIGKLSTSKQEQAAAHKDVQERLQAQLTALKKQVLEVDRTRKEAADLKAQIQGQHSIIVGLRTERDLWSKELAQQGASLAADRGKLESRIETLASENSSLRTQLQQEMDTVKIKAKVIQDQTETIGALKQKLAELERALLAAERDAETRGQEAEAAAADDRLRLAHLDEVCERLRSERSELQRRADDTLAELEQSKEALRVLKNKWKDKSTAVADLEAQVQRAKQTWEDGNRKLAEERDKAVLAADLALKKLRAADDVFRAQLDSKDAAQREAVQRLEQQYQFRLAEAESHVEQVENEMRELLASEALARKQTEAKLKQAADAFAQLQKELLS